MDIRRRWRAGLLALLLALGMLVLPACGATGTGSAGDTSQEAATELDAGEDAADSSADASGTEAAEAEDTATEDAKDNDSEAQSVATEDAAGEDASANDAEADDASGVADDEAQTDRAVSASSAIDEDGTYTSKEDVALYLHTYGHLPDNFVTKDEAEDAGWKTEGLSLGEAVPGKSIGGDRFGNREGKLPTAKGRKWYECDIGFTGGSRGAKRIVYSSDGLIYYTEDHYETFEQLY